MGFPISFCPSQKESMALLAGRKRRSRRLTEQRGNLWSGTLSQTMRRDISAGLPDTEAAAHGMRHLFVYADSLSWGIIPTTRERLRFDQRWPGVLEGALLKRGCRVRVLEDCLNGRRTVF